MARPREFDRGKALEAAMETFWDHGYEGTSTALLEERMGIGRSSLYAAFGSKDELYAESMEAYARNLRRRVIAKLRAPGPAWAVLRDFFLEVAERGGPLAGPLRCCMIVRACLSQPDLPQAIKSRIASSMAELDDAFHGLLLRAHKEGSVSATLDLHEAARFLTTTLQALNVAAHAGRSRRELRDVVERALSTLG